jgi:hypothetical protein
LRRFISLRNQVLSESALTYLSHLSLNFLLICRASRLSDQDGPAVRCAMVQTFASLLDNLCGSGLLFF